MTGAALVAVPFAGLLLARGLRDPALWSALAALLFAAAWRERKRAAPLPAAWLPWLAWACLAALFSGQALRSLPALSRWAGVLCFFALARALWGEKEKRAWLLALFACAPVLAVAGLWTGWRTLVDHGSGERMHGLLWPYYNYTAFVEAAAAAAALALLARAKDLTPARRRAILAAGLVAVAWLLVARARGALLALAVGATVTALRRWDLRRFAKAGALSLAVLGAATLGFGAMQGRSLSFFWLKPDKLHTFKRPQLWAAAAGVAWQAPVTGEGPGQFEKGYRWHVVPAGFGVTSYQFSTEHAHSEPLEAAAETGFVGLALWLAAMLLSFPRRVEASAEAEAGLAAAAAMAAQLLIDNMLQLPGLALLFFGCLACARPREERRWKLSPAVCLAGAALCAVAWVPGALAVRWERSGTLEDARRLAALYPKEPAPREHLARLLQGQRPPQLEEAEAQLDAARALAPYNAYDLVWRAELLRALGRWREAEPLALEAAALEPNFVQARLIAAEADARAGRKAAGREKLREARALRERLVAQGVDADPTRYTPMDRIVASLDEGRYALVAKQLR